MSARYWVLLMTLSALAQSGWGQVARVSQKRGAGRAPRARAEIEAPAQVKSVTADAVFLNRGAADGLAIGQSLPLRRGTKVTGQCVVEAVSEHFARCTGAGFQEGDRFAIKRVKVNRPMQAEALPTPGEMARRAQAIHSLEWTLRDFDAGAYDASALGTRVEALLSHTTYGNRATANGPFGIQRLDVAVYDVELWKGLRASVDLTALNFSARPSVTRTVYQKSPVLLVHQLELGFRRADIPFSASLGRTWLRAATGLLVIDGAQAAWRFSEGFELGAYGGLLPDAARLTITPSQWAAGAFGRMRFSRGTGASATLAQLSARGGWSLRDVLGGRAEASFLASVWQGAVTDAHVSLEFGFGKTQAPGGLDAARLDVGWRPVEPLRLSGSVRYRGLPLTGLTEVGTVSPGQRAIHSDVGLTWELARWLLIGGQAGLAMDFDSRLYQVRVGPEISLPKLFSAPVGLSVGYLEELGWLRGRHGYMQVNVAPVGLFRLLTRASWFQQQAVDGALGLATDELGASLALEVTPWRMLKARLLVMGRVPLSGHPVPLGSVGVQVGGLF